jgi:hypothetical protein
MARTEQEAREGRDIWSFIRRAAPSIVVSVLATLITGIVFPLYYGRAIGEDDLLVGTLTFATVFTVVWAAWSEKGDLLAPIPILSVLMFFYFVVRSVFLLNGHVDDATLAPNLQGNWREYTTPALELATAAWLSALLLVNLPIWQWMVRRSPRSRMLSSSIKPLRVIFLLLLGLGVIGYSIVSHRYSTFQSGEHNAETDTWVFFGCGLANMALALYASEFFSGRQKRVNNVILWPIALPATVAFGVLTGSKFNVVLPLLLVAMAFHYFRRRIGLRHIAAGIIPIILVVIPVIGAYRALSGAKTHGILSVEENIELIGESMSAFVGEDEGPGSGRDALTAATNRHHGLDSLMIAVKMTPAYIPYQDGSLYWQFPLLCLVPRFIWKDKPVMIVIKDFGTRFWGAAPDNTSSFAPQMMGAAYIAFGFWGAVVVFSLCILFFQLIYLVLRHNWGWIAFALYCSIFPYILRLETDIPGTCGIIIQQTIVSLLALQIVRDRGVSRARRRAFFRAPQAGLA